MRRRVAGSTIIAAVAAMIAVPPTSAHADECTLIWNNYKDSRFWIYPDKHGHQGSGGEEPGGEWEYQYSLGSTGSEYHDWFEEGTYAESQHPTCTPTGGGGN